MGSAETAAGEGRDSAFTEQDIDILRKSGEKLGLGLRFEGGGKASECVKRLFIQCCSPESPAARAKCSWGGIVEGDQILSIGGQEIRKLTRLECVKALKDSPVTVNMRIRHYFNQLTQNSSYDLQSDTLSQGDKKSSTLPKQTRETREKTSQTSPKKPLRSITKKSEQGSDQDLGSRIKQAGKRALTSSQSLRISSSVPTLGHSKGFAETDPKASELNRTSVPSSTKKSSRGSPKASSARELIEKKGIAQKDEKASTLPRKGAIYAKKDSSSRKVTTLPRNSSENADSNFSRESSRDSFISSDSENTNLKTQESRSLESLSDIMQEANADYLEFSQTLPKSYKADQIKSEWRELMGSTTMLPRSLSGNSLTDFNFWHTLPKSYCQVKSAMENNEMLQEKDGGIRRVLTVQEKLHSDSQPPPAELYVNLIEEEDSTMRYESDDTASTVSNQLSQRPTPAQSKLNTPHSSFSAADRSKPTTIDLAKLLDPFEQLEREFGWEGGLTIRPPSAFCSLADIQEDTDEKVVDEDGINDSLSDKVREISEVIEGSGRDNVS